MNNKISRSRLKNLIFEIYVEHLRKSKSALKEDSEKNSSMVFSGGEGQQLPNSTDQILTKFPTVKHALIRLHSEEFNNFVSQIDWISPKPSVFRVNLTNGQNYTLTWMGKDFEMNILGKSYYLGTLSEFQRALQKLTILYQEGPVESAEDNTVGNSTNTDSFGGNFGGSGGDFPGEDISPVEDFDTDEETGGDEDTETPEEGGEEDLKDEPLDFETDSEI